MNDRHDDDLMIVDDIDVFENVVFESNESVRQYLKAEWIESILAQMVNERISAGMSQKLLGVNIGKSQPAIARLEQSADVKLSTLWDYYAGLGLAPRLELDLESLDRIMTRLQELHTRGSELSSLRVFKRQKTQTTYRFVSSLSARDWSATLATPIDIGQVDRPKKRRKTKYSFGLQTQHLG